MAHVPAHEAISFELSRQVVGSESRTTCGMGYLNGCYIASSIARADDESEGEVMVTQTHEIVPTAGHWQGIASDARWLSIR